MVQGSGLKETFQYVRKGIGLKVKTKKKSEVCVYMNADIDFWEIRDVIQIYQ